MAFFFNVLFKILSFCSNAPASPSYDLFSSLLIKISLLIHIDNYSCLIAMMDTFLFFGVLNLKIEMERGAVGGVGGVLILANYKND